MKDKKIEVEKKEKEVEIVVQSIADVFMILGREIDNDNNVENEVENEEGKEVVLEEEVVNVDDGINNNDNENNDNNNLNIEKIRIKWEAQYAKDVIRINTIINGNNGKTVENNLREEITLLKKNKINKI